MTHSASSPPSSPSLIPNYSVKYSLYGVSISLPNQPNPTQPLTGSASGSGDGDGAAIPNQPSQPSQSQSNPSPQIVPICLCIMTTCSTCTWYMVHGTWDTDLPYPVGCTNDKSARVNNPYHTPIPTQPNPIITNN
ncbi:hypothetical protein BO94DRAFT_572788 [Aspergillus sclerotioniger CBS 115572]|uniref:Uncharacterized protein n=1 Tax=Aspergillus sclerotioniger CBS 115572 TaxID=1450535 RepID=A0A317X7Q0_9EURO|nr:hypothetical protein BO94DRAFT_572788 [Aspergillus sclerotioniger CBS 115572]PWY94315.1 hypothetical protein BO94DRAFT_572788 [Aspergillus sclerotioniger CBS 115572]